MCVFQCMCIYIYTYQGSFLVEACCWVGFPFPWYLDLPHNQLVLFLLMVFVFFGSNILDGQFLFPSAWHQKQLHRSFQKNWKIHPIIQSLSAFALAAVTSRCQSRTVWVKVNVAEPTLEGLMDIVPWAPQWKDTVVASVQCRHRWLGRAGFLDARFVFLENQVISIMYIWYRCL